MKKVLFVFAVLLSAAIGASAQLEKPVTWSYLAKKTGNEALVYIKATIEPGWHIYSQHLKEGGPSKTIFTFSPSKDYALVGKTVEPKAIVKFEKVFNMNVAYFEKQVVFTQKVKLNKGATVVKGTVEFMVCNDKSCLPPDEVQFSVPVK